MMRWFRALLRLFPSDFRGDFGPDMQDVFSEELRDARGGRARVWWRNAVAMLRLGPRLHAEQTWQDVRHAARTLRRSPTFTVVAVVALAFGTGSAVTTFSIADAFLLRPLPFRDPSALVDVWSAERARGLPTLRSSLQEYRAWARHDDVFAGLAVFNYGSVELEGGAEPERVSSGSVSANVFDVLGVTPLLGRTFLAGEDAPGAAPVALISAGFWRARFGGRSDVLSSTLDISGTRYAIVGVMPDSFVFPLPTTKIWIPRVLDPSKYTADVQPFQIVGRLQAGLTRERADAILNAGAAELQRTYPALAGRTASVVPLRQALDFAHDIFSIGTVVVGLANLLLLLTACANISSLMLGRAVRRGREVAVRAALGASRFRLVRQFLVESLLLATVGGLGGALLAWWGTGLASRVIPGELFRTGSIAVDVRALLVAAALSLLAALAFGLAPALRFARANLGEAMRQDGGTGTTSRSSLRLQSLMVQQQVALSVVLLVAMVLVGRSVAALGGVDPGFDASGVEVLQVVLPAARYSGPPAVAAFQDDVLARVRAVPGVVSAATVNFLPLNHETDYAEVSLSGAAPPPGTRLPEATVLAVSPQYFDVMRIAVLQGRSFTTDDKAGRPPVVIVNASMARRRWPNRSPLGARVQLDDKPDQYTVVGVVANTRQVDLTTAGQEQIFVPQAQDPWAYLRVLARTSGDPRASVPALVAAVHAVDPLLPVVETRPLAEVVNDYLLPQRSLRGTLLVIGAFSLWLALFGIYGIVACYVADRTREIGVRVALGADERRIVRHVMSRGLKLATRGAGAGLLLAIGASFAARSLLFGVGPADSLTYLLVTALVIFVAAAAGWLPARRAARVDPVIAIKTD
jgi:putative ABC transport system permease protein